MKSTVLVTICVLAASIASTCVTFGSPLDRAISMVPRDLSEIMLLFTDWSQIKSQIGLEGTTSESPLSDRLELARCTSHEAVAASAYALMNIQSHSVAWGWDTSDLAWEAEVVSREFPPVYILQLRHDFDFSRVAEHFEERGFERAEAGEAVIYSHKLDPSADWIRTTELSILNTAVIAEEKLLILSSSKGAVDVLLAVLAGDLVSLAEDPFTAAASKHLDTPNSAIVLRGLGECIRFTPNPILDLLGAAPSDERLEEIEAEMEEGKLLVPYRALGVGYHVADGHPIGSVIFEYDSPELAAMDLPARLLLAQVGTSNQSKAPISECCFTVLDSDVQDSAIILTVSPTNTQPSRLFRMILHLDAVFAGCSS